MEIGLLRLLFDFGLLVLVWLVQLVVYPSFLHYPPENLIKWHKKYTYNILIVVLPLMTGQLFFWMFELLHVVSIYTVLGMLLIIAVWLSTFFVFVPIHNKISSGLANDKILGRLVRQNWLRTAFWTLIFVCSYCAFFE